MPESSGLGLLLIGAAVVGFVYANGVRVTVPRDEPPAARRTAAASPAAWQPPARDPFRRDGLIASPVARPDQMVRDRPSKPFPALALSASFLGPSGRVALVNGVPLAPGDVLEGALLVEVHREEAVFSMDSRLRRIPIATLAR